MELLVGLVRGGVYVLMGVSILAALGAVGLPNIFHAALALAAVLVGAAGLYVALGAEFLAAVQILLYVGAVMTLIIFAIMMTERMTDVTLRSKNRLSIVAFLVAAPFLFFLIRLIHKTPWPIREANLSTHVGVIDIGTTLMTTFVFPFEVISVVLIAALIGAVVVARKDSE